MFDTRGPKSTVDEIRQRFDADVDRFSNLETGQAAIFDAPLLLELVTRAAAAATPQAKAVLDVGCGAGNYTLKLLERLPQLEVALVDLSQPMLDRAVERISHSGAATRVTPHQSDIRALDLPEGSLDVILAASVLHHLRTDQEWQQVFAKFHRWLRPGGSIWISDLVTHDDPAIAQIAVDQYSAFLLERGGVEYRDKVFAYVAAEDTPRSVMFQLDTLRRVGFARVEVLHAHACFAAFGGVKAL
jgi:tRNA (cmo5U34)-methyltransferase